MEQNFLLTYTMDGSTCFEWFESEEELKIFVKTQKKYKEFSIMEAIEILGSREINIK